MIQATDIPVFFGIIYFILIAVMSVTILLSAFCACVVRIWRLFR